MIKENVWKDICDKVEGINDMDWQEIIDKYELGIARDTLRKAVTGEFGSYKMVKEMLENHKSDDTEILSQLEDKRKELELLTIQYRDERNANNRIMRPIARHMRMLEVIREEMAHLEPIRLEPKKHEIKLSPREASLLISDFHYGIKCNNYWNQFDTQIAKERMQKLVEETLCYCKTMEVDILHIELLGDLISGVIHQTLRLENEVDVVRQSIECSELLAQSIVALAKSLAHVNVYMTVGNHSRISAKKEESIDKENFEYLIWEFLKIRLESISNISLVTNDIDETFIHYTVGDEHIFGVHGHLDKMSNIVSKFSTLFNGTKIKAIHCGHLHHTYVDDVNNIHVIMNGSLSGVDTYSKNGRFCNHPTQTLLVYDRDNTIHFNIVL